MRIIPQKLKDIFSSEARKANKEAKEARKVANRAIKKVRRDAQEAERAAAAIAEENAAPEPGVWWSGVPAPPRDRLAPMREPEGYYTVNIDIKPQMGHPNPQQRLQLISGNELDFHLALIGPSPLACCKTIAASLEEHLIHKYNVDIGQVYFKIEGPAPQNQNFFIEGYEQTIGLPPGSRVKAILIPEDCEWKPNPALIAPKAEPLPGTGTLLAHPWSLLRQFGPQFPWALMYVNGFDVMTPQMPQIPGAPAPESVDLNSRKPEVSQAAEKAVAEVTGAAAQEAPLPAAPAAETAKPTPAAAPETPKRPPGTPKP